MLTNSVSHAGYEASVVPKAIIVQTEVSEGIYPRLRRYVVQGVYLLNARNPEAEKAPEARRPEVAVTVLALTLPLFTTINLNSRIKCVFPS